MTMFIVLLLLDITNCALALTHAKNGRSWQACISAFAWGFCSYAVIFQASRL